MSKEFDIEKIDKSLTEEYDQLIETVKETIRNKSTNHEKIETEMNFDEIYLLLEEIASVANLCMTNKVNLNKIQLKKRENVDFNAILDGKTAVAVAKMKKQKGKLINFITESREPEWNISKIEEIKKIMETSMKDIS